LWILCIFILFLIKKKLDATFEGQRCVGGVEKKDEKVLGF